MIAIPKDAAGAAQLLAGPVSGAHPVVRAGGTDLQVRRRLGLPASERDRPVVDLRDVAGLDAIAMQPDGLRIGAMARVADIATHPDVVAGYGGFAAAAADLANPQIRAVATLGGNLLQRVRCWYFRSPEFNCLKKGGMSCFAREGEHLLHSCFDLGACVAPHPSTLGLALVAYDGWVEVEGKGRRSAATLYGNGADPRREHQLDDSELLVAAGLPPAVPGEKSAYFRVASRAAAEWPLVDVVARVQLDGGNVRSAAIALGGVANIPLRSPALERALVGRPATDATWAELAPLSIEGANPLPGTRYKLDLIPAAVREALSRAVAPRG